MIDIDVGKKAMTLELSEQELQVCGVLMCHVTRHQ